ncbi:MAG: transposase [Phycisphaerales bacterium]|jgi:transposase
MGKQIHSEEFKKGAVDQVLVHHRTISSVSKALGVNYHTLRGWVDAARAVSPGVSSNPALSDQQRIRELEKENARLRTERDILKKATAYFAKEHL